jgi:hypothetical protein
MLVDRLPVRAILRINVTEVNDTGLNNTVGPMGPLEKSTPLGVTLHTEKRLSDLLYCHFDTALRANLSKRFWKSIEARNEDGIVAYNFVLEGHVGWQVQVKSASGISWRRS